MKTEQYTQKLSLNNSAHVAQSPAQSEQSKQGATND